MWDNAITTLKDYPAPYDRTGLFGAPLTDGLLLDTLHSDALRVAVDLAEGYMQPTHGSVPTCDIIG